ncbi:MAG: hypothetical protein JO250_24535 [Armatimonadetes bacterium]|nr:hypothetical protein [Armatimonadota bacterium]
MTEQDEHAPEARAPLLSRRAVLGGLAAASMTPWLINAARGDDSPPQSALNAPIASSTTPLPRQQHTATAFGNGLILVAGGLHHGVLAGAEIYGPDGRLHLAAPMNTPRYAHAAVPIDGGVLVLGGYGRGPLADVEFYDPKTNSWTPKKPLNLPRYAHAAIHVSGAQILLIGGCFRGVLSNTEMYVL